MEAQLASIVSRAPVRFSHPGQSLPTGLYPSVHTAMLDMIAQEVTRGKVNIPSNGTNFGSSSQMLITPGSFISSCWINAEVALGTNVLASSDWGLNSIQSIEYTISNASASGSISLTGESHSDLIKIACETEEKRTAVANCCPAKTAAAAASVKGSFPLWLPFSMPNAEGQFSLDSSTLPSSIIVTIRWKPSYNVFSVPTAQIANLPAAWTSLNLRAKASQLVGADQFKVAAYLNDNPTSVYPIPFYSCQSANQTVSITSGVVNTVTLTSMPNAELAAILIKLDNQALVGSPAANVLLQNEGIQLSYVNLKNNGNDLLLFGSNEEYRLSSAIDQEGDGYRYNIVNATGLTTYSDKNYQGEVCVLPLVWDLKNAIMKKQQMSAINYGGGTLQLSFNTAAATGTYNMTITYVTNAILEISKMGVTIVQ
jgi:hypothetical protein